MKKYYIVLLFMFLIYQGWSQSILKLSNAEIEQHLMQEVCLLASDSLLGREAGTFSEWMALKYIESHFRSIGLLPLFDTSFVQPFMYNDYQKYTASGTEMHINNREAGLYTDFFPLSYSMGGSVEAYAINAGYGIVCEGHNSYEHLSDCKGKIFIIDLSAPPEFKSQGNFPECLTKAERIRIATEHGAKGIIFINTDSTWGKPSMSLDYYPVTFDIPVVFLKKNDWVKTSEPLYIKLTVNISGGSQRQAYNIGGYIDNNANTTVVIGAHYDHVGMGFFGSRETNKYNVHNGADDNASGTAAVIELARMLKQSCPKNNNYIFLLFSAEEKGLYGSDHFVKSGAYPLSKINYMINIDMIGKYGDHKLELIGTGTSPQWKRVIKNTPDEGLNITMVKAGFGGSDHMSFYKQKIPSLFLHTGLHKDYHTSRDDCNKINYQGMVSVIQYIYGLIGQLDNHEKLNFRSIKTLDFISKMY